MLFQKKALYHYAELINKSENKFGTAAFIVMPSTIDTAFNREAMHGANFSEWTKPTDIAFLIRSILEGEQEEKIVEP